MLTPMWRQYQQAPWIQFKPCACKNGGFDVIDTRTQEQVWAPDMGAVAQFAADRSTSQQHYPVGDAIHNVTQRLGIKRCGGCAQRQATLNNMFRRRR